MNSLELVSPAKNLMCGIAAIEHGADAVYIGGPAFGARNAASNSLEDIAQLVSYAHRFHVKVFVALNTILYDSEIDQAIEIANAAYSIGADALIIQDLGLLECNLPPIPLHASTQLHNTTAEKVAFLEHVGFSQVVLARELSLSQIQQIHNQTNITLECFIHGALCVCYSGQCYMSAFATGRSGNRGECSQMCRHAYSITGLQQHSKQSAYYLSPKDLNLSQHIGDMIDAGVQSFKIEGRLKDEVYVKNCTAYYRRILDAEIAKRPSVQRSSHGSVSYSFTPDVHKSFSRSFTNYYIQNKRNSIANILSPKSVGEFIGTLTHIQGKHIQINTNVALANGDGLCYYRNNELLGVRINSVTGTHIELAEPIICDIGSSFWRNVSVEFIKQVERSKSCRYIFATAMFKEIDNGFRLTITDQYGYSEQVEHICTKELAQNSQKMQETITHNIQKTGASFFKITDVSILWNTPFFVPISIINETRRNCLQLLENKRQNAMLRVEKQIIKNTIPYPIQQPVDARLNCSNTYAQKFFERHGIVNVPSAFEIKADTSVPLMTTKYCIRYECGECPKQSKSNIQASPIYLKDNKYRYRVEFNCKTCEMLIFSETHL
ncbi:MAG: putative protease YhbU precursor [Bacteroidetes bacterium ADurb.Bin217]|nr:MAG: putative protease YhbU precursor [Bacteroidetes bacterium ADurb.Bin217]